MGRTTRPMPSKVKKRKLGVGLKNYLELKKRNQNDFGSENLQCISTHVDGTSTLSANEEPSYSNMQIKVEPLDIKEEEHIVVESDPYSFTRSVENSDTEHQNAASDEDVSLARVKEEYATSPFETVFCAELESVKEEPKDVQDPCMDSNDDFV